MALYVRMKHRRSNNHESIANASVVLSIIKIINVIIRKETEEAITALPV